MADKPINQFDPDNVLNGDESLLGYDPATGSARRYVLSLIKTFIGGITKINNKTAQADGSVILNTDDLNDSQSNNKFVTEAQKAKVDKLKTDGDGSRYLNDKGEYVPVSASAGSGGGIGAGDIVDSQTINLTYDEDAKTLQADLNYADSSEIELRQGVTGLYAQLTAAIKATFEPVFSKNTAFNKNFGTVAGTVAEGNDSRFADTRLPSVVAPVALAAVTASGQTVSIALDNERETSRRLDANTGFTFAFTNAAFGKFLTLTLRLTAVGTYTLTLPANSSVEGSGPVSSTSITTATSNEARELVCKLTTVDGTTIRYHWTISGNL
jgi:hypothetical protein